MGNFFEEISSDEIAEFRETFEEFMRSETPVRDPQKTALHESEKSLLDLLLSPDSSTDSHFGFKILELIQKVGELHALDIPRRPAASSDLLSLAYSHKKEILENLELKNFDETTKNLWRSRINDFFDRFTLELVKRWETIERSRHQNQIDEIEKSKKLLSQENSFLRKIYALSLQIERISTPDKIYEHVVKKIKHTIDFDFVVILDTSDKKPVEYIFHSDKTSIKDVEVGRRKTEDVYELFRREPIERESIEVYIENPSILRARGLPKNDPESVIVPMINDDNTWGMVGVFRKQGNPFTPQEVQAVSIVTSLVELVVSNQRALSRERALAKSLDEQIRFARKIQEGILPKQFSDNDLLIASKFMPSTTLTGDFYQFFKTNLNERGAIIGDVTGHDIAAAMMMMNIMGILNDVFLLDKIPLEEMIKKVNTRLHNTINEQFFVTTIALWIDKSGEFKYLNMGHPTGLILHKNSKTIDELPPTGFPLGIFDDPQLNSKVIDFQKGDRALLYTDGLIEAKNENNKNFGLDRLKNIFLETLHLDIQTTLDHIMHQLNIFTNSSDFPDDIAIVIIERK